jgi:hypothetical protein
MRPPRALYVDFPLGLPLGKSLDSVFQHSVLDAAFKLLEKSAGPVLEEFPEVINADTSLPLVCSLPPTYDPNLHPAVDEAQALRGAYDRALAKNGRTSIGEYASASQIPNQINKFAMVAAGEPWDEVGFDAPTYRIAQDIRAYYEELAGELAEGPASAQSIEDWFYEQTVTGGIMTAARKKMRDADAPFLEWFLITPDFREGK